MSEEVRCRASTVGVLRVDTVRRSRAPRLADIPRHSAVDVANGAAVGANGTKWTNETSSRLSTYPTTGDRTALLRSHAAKSAEIGPQSPRPRRAPRESRRVSLAQASGYVQLNQYRLLEPIGQGSYGIVKLAYNEEDDTHYAMKILSKRKLMRRAGLFGRAPPRLAGPGPPPDPLQRVYREIAVLKKLDHPNVVKLVEVLDDPAEDQLYLVFQLLEGGPVIDIPTDNPLNEELARKYFRDALLGVEYLHYQRIAHRDIKPANLLLGEDRVQVADLGACGELAGRLSGAVGTPAFRAPEAAALCENYCGEAADIWSLGVTLYAMVTGRVPWTGSSSVELQQRVVSEPLTYPPRHQPSKQLQHLLSRMLDKDPVKRATMKEIKEHPWVTSDGQDPLPSEEENCRLVEVTEEDMARVVTSIPNLSTLILIKTMLKKHSFQNPFLRSRENSAARERERRESVAVRRGADRGGMLARTGRSLSAPGNYLTERQASFDVALESVDENKDQNQEPIRMIRDDSQSSSISSSPGQSSSSLGQSSSSLGQSSSSLTGKCYTENLNYERNPTQTNINQHGNHNKLSKFQSVCKTGNCYSQNKNKDNSGKNSSQSGQHSNQSGQHSSQRCTNPFQSKTNSCQINTNPFQTDTNRSQSHTYSCQSGKNPFSSDTSSSQSGKYSSESAKSSSNDCQSSNSKSGER